MEKSGNKEYRFGLIGKNISYSFSRGYFTKKFEQLGLSNFTYSNFDLKSEEELASFLKENKFGLKGLNVTIPYKESVIKYLDEIDPKAEAIGAVNTIKFTDNGLKGYNTDIYGFENSLTSLLGPQQLKALILGTGGASKAIAFVLDALNISYLFVSRNPIKGQLGYVDLNDIVLDTHQLIINCTPIGTYPSTEESPDIPYDFVSSNHLFFDLIYNPAKTKFLRQAEERGATISNGLKMLELQAEKSWEIWNS